MQRIGSQDGGHLDPRQGSDPAKAVSAVSSIAGILGFGEHGIGRLDFSRKVREDFELRFGLNDFFNRAEFFFCQLCSQFVEIVERIGVLTVADDTVDQVRVGFREINAGVVGCFLNLILFGNRTGRRFG